jgi:hypothetical protein
MSRASASRRQIVGRSNANLRWAFEPDRTAATAPARRALEDRFASLVDPDLKLSPAERGRRIKNLKSAHYAMLGLKSGEARRARAAGKKATG